MKPYYILNLLIFLNFLYQLNTQEYILKNCKQNLQSNPQNTSQGPDEQEFQICYENQPSILNDFYLQQKKYNFEVQISGTYEITVVGGFGTDDTGDHIWPGARIEALYELEQGQILELVVGQNGEKNDEYSSVDGTSGAQGGNTFIYDKIANNLIILAAGGPASPDTRYNSVEQNDGVQYGQLDQSNQQQYYTDDVEGADYDRNNEKCYGGFGGGQCVDDDAIVQQNSFINSNKKELILFESQNDIEQYENYGVGISGFIYLKLQGDQVQTLRLGTTSQIQIDQGQAVFKYNSYQDFRLKSISLFDKQYENHNIQYNFEYSDNILNLNWSPEDFTEQQYYGQIYILKENDELDIYKFTLVQELGEQQHIDINNLQETCEQYGYTNNNNNNNYEQSNSEIQESSDSTGWQVTAIIFIIFFVLLGFYILYKILNHKKQQKMLKVQMEDLEKQQDNLKPLQNQNELQLQQINKLQAEKEKLEKENDNYKLKFDDLDQHQKDNERIIKLYEQESVQMQTILQNFGIEGIKIVDKSKPEEKKELKPIPNDMKCPISGVMFVDPVINFAGNIYDREDIEAIYENQKKKQELKGMFQDPVSRKKSKDRTLVKSHQLKNIVIEILKNQYSIEDLLFDLDENQGEIMQDIEFWLDKNQNKNDIDYKLIDQKYKKVKQLHEESKTQKQ